MAQSLAQIYIHLIFSVKDRVPVLQPEIRPDLISYFGGICEKIDSPLICAGIVADHTHLLFRQSKTIPLSKSVERIKTGSSHWLKRNLPRLDWFHWQSGYGAFSVSASRITNVQEYILRQEEHHRNKSFQEEFKEFLDRYGVEYDERYLWE